MAPGNIPSGLMNHLWQSTAFALLAWPIAFALRRNSARIRYWVWLVASLKFLLPFSLLISAGELLRLTIPAPAPRPALTAVVERVAEPASAQEDPVPHAPSFTSCTNDLFIPIFAVWACGSLIFILRFWRTWNRINATVRGASPIAIAAANVPVLLTNSLLEPGVFGIFHPVLLLPESVLNRLSPAQIKAIVAHEMCHVRQRDNLTYAMHMVVEAVFWFHPLVWWIGAHLIDERERACDEAALEGGNDAEDYAAGILGVCKLYAASPLACASGISGSDLRERIVRIMAGSVSKQLDFSRKLLIATAIFSAIAAPVAFGLVRPARLRISAQAANAPAKLPEFEVAIIRPSEPGASGSTFSFTPNEGVEVKNATLKGIIEMAYDVRDFQIDGGPGWVNSRLFNITAKSTTDGRELSEASSAESIRQTRLRLQALLAQRFGLAIRRESKDLPIYALTAGKNGTKLEESGSNNASSSPAGINAACGQMIGTRTSMANLAYKLSRLLSRPVVDRTGLSGSYDFQLHFSPETGPCSAGTFDANASGDNSASDDPSIFTAIQEQLGLKLESEKGPVDVLIIDHVEQPSPN
jgi:bla regulator protein blaR1